MKIALCLSGQPRFIDRSHDNIRQTLMDGYDVDVFVHAWVDENNPYRFKNDGANKNWENRLQDPKSKQNIIDWFQPKKAMFETPKIFAPAKMNGVPTRDFFMPLYQVRSAHSATEQGSRQFVESTHSEWYSIMMANTQKELYRCEVGVEYDWVVRARFDVIYKAKIRYEGLDPNILYAASRVEPEHIHDFMAVGSSKNMNAYSSMFPNLEYYFSKTPPDWRCSEGALCQCMKHYGIQCQALGEIITILRPGENV